MFSRALILFVMLFIPAIAGAQSRWDIAAHAGLFAGYREPTGGGYQESWFHSAQGGATVGHYLTPHIKLELDATLTTAGDARRERYVVVPGYPYPYPVGSEVSTAVHAVAATASWQFGVNDWVHPFVQAGLSADFERIAVRTWEQRYFGDAQRGIPPTQLSEDRVDGPVTARSLGALVGAGAKIYVAERTFLRTEARWTFDRTRHNLALRFGFGVDL